MNMIRQKLEMYLRQHSPAQPACCGRRCTTLRAALYGVACAVACVACCMRDRTRSTGRGTARRTAGCTACPAQTARRTSRTCMRHGIPRGTVSHAARYPTRNGIPRGNDDARRTTCSRRRRCSPSPLGDGPSSPCTSPARSSVRSIMQHATARMEQTAREYATRNMRRARCNCVRMPVTHGSICPFRPSSAPISHL